MKTPKKPKLNSLPKRPKATAPVATWKNYEAKCKEVQKENARKLNEWKKRCNEIVSGSKEKEKIQKRTHGLGRVAGK